MVGALQEVLILGPGLLSSPDGFLKLKPEYFIIGDGKRDISLDELNLLRGIIDFHTKITILMYGNKDGKNSLLDSSEIFQKLGEVGNNNPLNIDLLSSYAKTASDDVTFLPAGSVLTLLSPMNNLTRISADYFRETHYQKCPIKSFLENIINNLSTSFNVVINLNGERKELITFPDIEEVFSNPKSAIEKLEKEYIQNYKAIKGQSDNSLEFTLKKDQGFIREFQLAVLKGYCLQLDSRSSIISDEDRIKLTKISNALDSIKEREVIKKVYRYIIDRSPNIEVIKLFLARGIGINEPGMQQTTALYACAQKGLYDSVKYLIEEGADVNRFDQARCTPLYTAAYNGHRYVVELLIREGADVNKVTADDYTPLYVAAQNGHEEVVRLLIREGADVNKVTANYTPLYVAAQNGNREVVELLIREGADVNQLCKDGCAPIHTAAYNGHREIVELLIKAGADIKPTKAGHTPLRLAAHKGHKRVLELLNKYAAAIRKEEGSLLEENDVGNLNEELNKVLKLKLQLLATSKAATMTEKFLQENYDTLYFGYQDLQNISDCNVAEYFRAMQKGELNQEYFSTMAKAYEYAYKTGKEDLQTLLKEMFKALHSSLSFAEKEVYDVKGDASEVLKKWENNEPVTGRFSISLKPELGALAIGKDSIITKGFSHKYDTLYFGYQDLQNISDPNVTGYFKAMQEGKLNQEYFSKMAKAYEYAYKTGKEDLQTLLKVTFKALHSFLSFIEKRKYGFEGDANEVLKKWENNKPVTGRFVSSALRSRAGLVRAL